MRPSCKTPPRGRRPLQHWVFCALFSAMIAVGAFIQIPVPYMDYFTLQFFFVTLAGLLMGPALGSLCAAVYVAVGLMGIPVFAAGGGISYIFRPSFGFLLGFIAAAALSGFISVRLNAAARTGVHAFWRYLLAALAGMLVTYGIGFAYKYYILNFHTGQATPFLVVLLSAFPLDLPGDAVLCIGAAALAGRLGRILRKEHLI